MLNGLGDWVGDRVDGAKRGLARGFFDVTAGAFDVLGFEDAADNLRRYRSGRGGTQYYDDDQIAQHSRLMEAEDTARTRFESQTFLGRTRNNKTLNEKLNNRMRDGETYTFTDDWHDNFGGWGDAVTNRSTYLTFGRGDVKSAGKFTATRQGDRLVLRGSVTHGFDTKDNDNQFDFNPGQPGHVSGRILEEAGEAKPFRMQYERVQDVEAEARYENGGLTLDRMTWGSIR